MEPMITFALWSRLHPAHRRRQGATLLPSGLPVDDVAGRRWVVGALAGGTLTIPDLRDGPGTTRALGGVRKIPPQTDRPVPKPPDPVPAGVAATADDAPAPVAPGGPTSCYATCWPCCLSSPPMRGPLSQPQS
jgi:hypothetical protein